MYWDGGGEGRCVEELRLGALGNIRVAHLICVLVIHVTRVGNVAAYGRRERLTRVREEDIMDLPVSSEVVKGLISGEKAVACTERDDAQR